MPRTFDAIVKELAAAAPEAFVAFFAGVQGEQVHTLNVDLSTISSAADVAFGLGDPPHQIIHLDAQTGPDADLPRSVLLYNALLHRRYGVSVRSLVLLLHRKAQLANLTGVYGYAAGQTRLEFHYEVVRLWEQPARLLLGGPLVLLPLAVLGNLPGLQSQEVELTQVVEQVVARLQNEAAPGQLRQLLTGTFFFTGLRTTKEQARTIFREVTLMHESSTYMAVLEEGEINHAKRTLLKLGEIRFGPPPEATKAAIQAIEDLSQLDHLLLRQVVVRSWEELLNGRD